MVITNGLPQRIHAMCFAHKRKQCECTSRLTVHNLIPEDGSMWFNVDNGFNYLKRTVVIHAMCTKCLIILSVIYIQEDDRFHELTWLLILFCRVHENIFNNRINRKCIRI